MIKLWWRLVDRVELLAARRAYNRAHKACLRVVNDDSVPAGMWGALDDVRRAIGERLIDAEVRYLQGA